MLGVTTIMAIICPHCGVADQVTKLRHKQLLSLGHYIFGFVTGLIGILIWYFSLESKFQCGKCSQTFFARTSAAKVFRVLFHILVAALVIAALIMISIIVFQRNHDAQYGNRRQSFLTPSSLHPSLPIPPICTNVFA